LAYGNLDYSKKTGAVKNYNDFRDDIPARIFVSRENTYTIDATKVKYAENNLANKYGIPEYGASGLDRSDPTKAAVTSGDKIGTTTGAKDLIDFSMGLSTGTTLRFRAFINSISTNWSPHEEDGQKGSIGQVLKLPMYNGIEHQVTVDFVVPIFSRAERATILTKLDVLAKAFYGTGGKFRSNVEINLKIGKFLQLPCIMTSLSYDIDNETSWDIDSETPMVIACSISFSEIDSGTTPSATGTTSVIGF